MSKAQKIIDLLATTDLSNQEIAAQIGCLGAYVRVVQQRLAGTDWASRNPEKVRRRKAEDFQRRYATDQEFRKRWNGYSVAYAKSRCAVDPEFRARRAAHKRAYTARVRARRQQAETNP